ncbi:MAG: SDR family NAD(P)-dependent oxidoreductase [Patescibacteria group bacterium]
MNRLKNKIAIVTGAANGLGRAIADRLQSEGAKVVYSDIVEPDQALPEGCLFKNCDVSDRQAVDNLVAETVKDLGGLDIMINNAGIGVTGGLLETSVDDWQKVINVNLAGVFYGMQAVALFMKDKGIKGSIINISSILGGVGFQGALAYSASKGGVVQLTRSGALDLAPLGIRVNAIAPGFIDTNMTKQVKENPEFMQMVEANTPQGRMGKPEDIAAVAAYLASAEAEFTTGEIIYVDGGWMAR